MNGSRVEILWTIKLTADTARSPPRPVSPNCWSMRLENPTCVVPYSIHMIGRMDDRISHEMMYRGFFFWVKNKTRKPGRKNIAVCLEIKDAPYATPDNVGFFGFERVNRILSRRNSARKLSTTVSLR